MPHRQGYIDPLYYGFLTVNTESKVFKQDPWPLIPHLSSKGERFWELHDGLTAQ
jgi:hypothetical protein